VIRFTESQRLTSPEAVSTLPLYVTFVTKLSIVNSQPTTAGDGTAGGALGGAEIGAPVGFLCGQAVGPGVGLRQQISAVPVFNVVEQKKPQPAQETLSSRSPALQPAAPMPHAVWYWISSAAHTGCCSRRRAPLDDLFGQIGAAAP
jgi:hypothetical protein